MRKFSILRLSDEVLIIGFLALISTLHGEVRMPTIFSDHMVLQRSSVVPVWGWAEPNESVSVYIADVSGDTQTGSNGRWMLELNLQDVGEGPFTMTVRGENVLAIKDVVVGEVWLCSGQSNMELKLSQSINLEAEQAEPSNAMLRQFMVKKQSSSVPLDDVEGTWILAAPETVKDFGGVAYFFGKSLQQRLGVPVGLIHTAWGGSLIESWISSEALDSDPDLKQGKANAWERFEGYPELKATYHQNLQSWEERFGMGDHSPEDRPDWFRDDLDTSDWGTVTLPGLLIDQEMPSNGAVWFRKVIEFDDGPSTDGYGEVQLSYVGDFHQVYWDGKLKSETRQGEDVSFGKASFWLRTKSELAPGKHVITIRMFSQSDRGGIISNPTGMYVGPRKLNLTGEWQVKEEFALPALSSDARSSRPTPPPKPPLEHFVASRLYNGMIAPLIPYGISGVIWYQGESNGGMARQYCNTFKLLISEWRDLWGQGDDFPFYFCQLANFKQSPEQPGDSAWAELREAQAMAMDLPNTGQAVLIDTGLAEDIHPVNRKVQGERLARVALAKTYGQEIPYSGPVFDWMELEGARVRIYFKQVAGGLVARELPDMEIVRYYAHMTETKKKPRVLPVPNSEVQGFAICGDDHQWHWADARIDEDSVVVWSDAVSHPIAVRYAWADNPVCNLYDEAGLPASPFRTDEFPGVSNDRYFIKD